MVSVSDERHVAYGTFALYVEPEAAVLGPLASLGQAKQYDPPGGAG